MCVFIGFLQIMRGAFQNERRISARLFSEEAALGQSLNFQPVHNPSAALRPSAMAVTTRSEPRTYRRQQRFSGYWSGRHCRCLRGDDATLRIQLDAVFRQPFHLCGRKPNAMITASAGTICSDLPRSPRGDGLWHPVRPFRYDHFYAADFAVTVHFNPQWLDLNLNSTPSSRAFFTSRREPGCSLHHDDRHR